MFEKSCWQTRSSHMRCFITSIMTIDCYYYTQLAFAWKILMCFWRKAEIVYENCLLGFPYCLNLLGSDFISATVFTKHDDKRRAEKILDIDTHIANNVKQLKSLDYFSVSIFRFTNVLISRRVHTTNSAHNNLPYQSRLQMSTKQYWSVDICAEEELLVFRSQPEIEECVNDFWNIFCKWIHELSLNGRIKNRWVLYTKYAF